MVNNVPNTLAIKNVHTPPPSQPQPNPGTTTTTTEEQLKKRKRLPEKDPYVRDYYNTKTGHKRKERHWDAEEEEEEEFSSTPTSVSEDSPSPPPPSPLPIIIASPPPAKKPKLEGDEFPGFSRVPVLIQTATEKPKNQPFAKGFRLLKKRLVHPHILTLPPLNAMPSFENVPKTPLDDGHDVFTPPTVTWLRHRVQVHLSAWNGRLSQLTVKQQQLAAKTEALKTLFRNTYQGEVHYATLSPCAIGYAQTLYALENTNKDTNHNNQALEQVVGMMETLTKECSDYERRALACAQYASRSVFWPDCYTIPQDTCFYEGPLEAQPHWDARTRYFYAYLGYSPPLGAITTTTTTTTTRFNEYVPQEHKLRTAFFSECHALELVLVKFAAEPVVFL